MQNIRFCTRLSAKAEPELTKRHVSSKVEEAKCWFYVYFQRSEKPNVDFTPCFLRLEEANVDFTMCFRRRLQPNVCFPFVFLRKWPIWCHLGDLGQRGQISRKWPGVKSLMKSFVKCGRKYDFRPREAQGPFSRSRESAPWGAERRFWRDCQQKQRRT